MALVEEIDSGERPQCVACGQPCLDGIDALGGLFHRKCFTCANCKLPVDFDECFVFRGVPYCSRRLCKATVPTSIYSMPAPIVRNRPSYSYSTTPSSYLSYSSDGDGGNEHDPRSQTNANQPHASDYSDFYSYSNDYSNAVVYVKPQLADYHQNRGRAGFFSSFVSFEWGTDLARTRSRPMLARTPSRR